MFCIPKPLKSVRFAPGMGRSGGSGGSFFLAAWIILAIRSEGRQAPSRGGGVQIGAPRHRSGWILPPSLPPSMLDLLAFDLDGTLADTEDLKAKSYAWAAHRLRPDLDPDTVEAGYADCIGYSRQEISEMLLHRFDLEDAARAHDGSVDPWQSYVGLRLERYRAMLADVALVRAHARPAADLVRDAHALAHRVALVTTSGRRNASLVLAALGLSDAFDDIITADDVTRTKPDPEGYRLALSRARATPARSLAVEDSPAGVRAALAAEIPVFAVPDELTRHGIKALVAEGALPATSVFASDALAAGIRSRAEAV